MRQSLSARRAWIEILSRDVDGAYLVESLSARRAWIEIVAFVFGFGAKLSLSARRAWIEIIGLTYDGLIASGRSPQGERG